MFLVKAASGTRCPVQGLEGADCWLLLQPMGPASHSKVSKIPPRPERMWRAPPCVGRLPEAGPGWPSLAPGCAMGSRQAHILRA